MNILLIFITSLLGHLCIYFCFKKNTDTVKETENENSKLKEIHKALTLTNNTEDNKHILLNRSLKHLEFIAQFEMYLEQKSIKNFSEEFTQEFKKIKLEAQIKTIKTTIELRKVA